MRDVVIGKLTKPDGTVLSNTKIAIKLINQIGNDVVAFIDGNIVASYLEVTTDSLGYVTVSLFENDLSELQNTYYNIYVPMYPEISCIVYLESGEGSVQLAELVAAGTGYLQEDVRNLRYLLSTLTPAYDTEYPTVKAKATNGVMLTTANLNAVTAGGRYGVIGSGHSNTPSHSGEFALDVTNDGTRVMQVATFLDGSVYTRWYSGSVWSSWVTHMTSNNPHGVTAAQVGLGNVANESKSVMFTSPAFTGIPTAPTASIATDSTQLATTAFVWDAIASYSNTGVLAWVVGANSSFTDAYGTVNGSKRFDTITAALYEASKYSPANQRIYIHIDPAHVFNYSVAIAYIKSLGHVRIIGGSTGQATITHQSGFVMFSFAGCIIPRIVGVFDKDGNTGGFLSLVGASGIIEGCTFKNNSGTAAAVWLDASSLRCSSAITFDNCYVGFNTTASSLYVAVILTSSNMRGRTMQTYSSNIMCENVMITSAPAEAMTFEASNARIGNVYISGCAYGVIAQSSHVRFVGGATGQYIKDCSSINVKAVQGSPVYLVSNVALTGAGVYGVVSEHGSNLIVRGNDCRKVSGVDSWSDRVVSGGSTMHINLTAGLGGIGSPAGTIAANTLTNHGIIYQS